MNRTISVEDARQRWNDIVDSVRSGDDVLVEAAGETQVVVISPETYRELQELRDKRRRAESLEWLRSFEQEQLERNKDLTDAEIEEIAIQVGREINAAVTKKWRARLAERKNSK